MNAVDIKNFELIDKYIKQYGFDEDSEKYAFQEIRTPNLDESYKSIVGDDLRKRWIITNDNTGFYDESWKSFKRYFANYKRMGIGYEEFKSNKILINKNTVKIKKVMTDFYMENLDRFANDFKGGVDTGGFDSSKKNSSENKKIIEAYIIKSFEIIGTQKSPNSELQLVLSLNFADWLLCSTKESWSSCLCLDGGAYWTGIMSLIGDKNRAFMYVTNGSKKDWHGIIVDSAINRSWVLLNDRDEKKIVKFYPNEFVTLNDIRKITNDQTYTQNITSSRSKHEIVPIKFKKAGVWATVYNDGCGLDRTELAKTGKLMWDYSRGRVCDVVSVPNRSSDNVAVGRTKSTLHDYLEAKKEINDDVQANVCSCCGTTSNLVVRKGNDRYCGSCATKLLTKCKHCGEWEFKKDIDIYTIDNKPQKICKVCVSKTYICHSCGLRYYKGSGSHSISKNRTICDKCFKTNSAECPDCNQIFLKNETILHETKNVCLTCFGKKKYNGWYACEDCRTSFKEIGLVFNYKGEGTCHKCVKKAVYNNAKQMKFSFARV